MKTESHLKSSNSSHRIISVSILSAALLVGLICGSLIISKSIRDAHRFHYEDSGELVVDVFDSYRGHILRRYEMAQERGWEILHTGEAVMPGNSDTRSWVRYINRKYATDDE